MAERVSVMIVDDQPPFRDAARAVLSRIDGFDLVAEVDSGEEGVVATSGELRPDLVLMDINMGALDGIEATRLITDAHPETKVILVSTYSLEDLPVTARSSGAIAYVNKDELSPRVVRRLWESGGDPAWLTPPDPAEVSGRPSVGCAVSRTADTPTGSDGEWQGTEHGGAAAGDRRDVERAAEGAEPVGHVDETVADGTAPGDLEAGAVVDDRERQRAVALGHRDADRGAVAGVLAGVLHRLEHAEVDRRLHVGRVPADAGRVERRRQRRPAAAAGSASARPPETSSGGKMPWASARSSWMASWRLPLISSIMAMASSGSSSTASRVRRSFTASATRCCWAPSCRLRSSLRRSASPAATMRARDCCSSSLRTCSSSRLACSAASSCTLCRARATWRASSVSTRSSDSVNASPSRRRVTTMKPSSSPAWATGARRIAAEPSGPTMAGTQMSSHVPPLTPARATTADSLAPIEIGGGLAVGHAGGQLEVPVLPRPHLRRHQHHRLAQALDELQQQLVHRDRPGEPLAERAQQLVGREALAVHQPVGALGQPAPSWEVEERRQRRRRPSTAAGGTAPCPTGRGRGR